MFNNSPEQNGYQLLGNACEIFTSCCIGVTCILGYIDVCVCMLLYTIYLETTKFIAHFIACAYSTVLHIKQW